MMFDFSESVLLTIYRFEETEHFFFLNQTLILKNVILSSFNEIFFRFSFEQLKLYPTAYRIQ